METEGTEFEFSADKSKKVTIGEYVARLLEEKNYFNTVLPRIPTLIHRMILKNLLSLPEKRQLKAANETQTSGIMKGASVLVRRDGWDGRWVPAQVTKVHYKASFEVGLPATTSLADSGDEVEEDDEEEDFYKDDDMKVIYKV